jgi:predicted SprT family Zn-dependent metalloprotease
MKKLVVSAGVVMLLSGAMMSCKKSATTDPAALTEEEKNLVMAAGFNERWTERTADGNYLIEGDILLTRAQLEEMRGQTPTNNFIVADDEHYRTYNTVKLPVSGTRNISVSMSSGFPSYYYTALQTVIDRYNSYGLRLTFSNGGNSGGTIHITGRDLGTSGGGCILGQAAGFPDANGNPAPGFTLSTSSCAISYLSTEAKADEVIAHEIGHCIGYRHTDYKRRNSCGPGAGESAGSIGAVHIPGTPTSVSGSYDSWMMACVNGSPNFNAEDGIALRALYQ